MLKAEFESAIKSVTVTSKPTQRGTEQIMKVVLEWPIPGTHVAEALLELQTEAVVVSVVTSEEKEATPPLRGVK